MFAPMTTSVLLCLCKRAASASQPSLLKPILLISACDLFRRNNRGFGLPPCGFGVTVPTSIKPNPSNSKARIYFPSLSNPAASPTGFLKVRPNTSVCKDWSEYPNNALNNAGISGIRDTILNKRIARWCALSAGKRKKNGLRNSLYKGGSFGDKNRQS